MRLLAEAFDPNAPLNEAFPRRALAGLAVIVGAATVAGMVAEWFPALRAAGRALQLAAYTEVSWPEEPCSFALVAGGVEAAWPWGARSWWPPRSRKPRPGAGAPTSWLRFRFCVS